MVEVWYPVVKRTAQMAQRLWQQSEYDMVAARRLLCPETYFAAANFAHQAAEKALKAAYWHLAAAEPPWKHDLLLCAARVGQYAGGVPEDVRVSLARLQPVFEESRYPSGDVDDPIPAALIGEEDAHQAVTLAEEVRGWVETLLQRPPGSAPDKTSF